jgi:hypothetical protein
LGTRPRKQAALSQDRFKYQECGLPGGTYSTRAQATDRAGATSPVNSGPEVTVSNLQAVIANWQAHMGAGRIRVYSAPCANAGFGSCDQGFSEIFLANMFNPFPLHRKATSNNWYVRRESIP